MKTLLTFAAACLFTLATMAAEHYPTLTIKSKKHFEFVIDGRKYYHDNFIKLDRIRRGMHTIEVYEHSQGFFGTRHRLISSRTFMVRNNDIVINVGYSGRVYVNEIGNGWGRNRGWNDRDYDNRNWDSDRNYDRSYDDDHDHDHDRNYDRSYDRNKRF